MSVQEDDFDYTDDLGYFNRDRYICTDPDCDGVDCPGNNH